MAITRFDAARGDVESPIINGAAVPSAAAVDLLVESHAVAARAVLLDATLRAGVELPLVEGSVTVDSGSTVRRSGSITILGQWSDDPRSQLSPTSGPRVKVQRGVRLPSGAIEWITLGHLRVVDAAQTDESVRAKMSLSLKDEFATIARDRFDVATSTDTTLTVVAQITALIRRTLPDAEVIDLTGSTAQCGKMDLQQDPAGGIAKLATSIGAVCYAGRGPAQFVIAPRAGVDDPPRWQLAVGEEGGNLISVARTRSVEKTYNRVFAKGETNNSSSSTAAPIPTGEALISDADDPLVYGGPFGRVTRFYTSSLLKTNEQCVAAAAGLLREAKGTEAEFKFTSLVNPALDSDQVIVSVLSDGKRRLHVVDSVTHPLSVKGSQDVSGRTHELTDEQQQADPADAPAAAS